MTQQEIEQKLNLVDSGKTCGISFVLGLKFWQTKYPGIYLTDYDFLAAESVINSNHDICLDLKKQDILYLFNNYGTIRNHFAISLLELDNFDSIIDEFIKCIKI